MGNESKNSEYSPEEFNNVLAMVRVLKRIRQELRDEGIPIDEYEELLKQENLW